MPGERFAAEGGGSGCMETQQKMRGWKIGQSNTQTNRKQTISEGCTDV